MTRAEREQQIANIAREEIARVESETEPKPPAQGRYQNVEGDDQWLTDFRRRLLPDIHPNMPRVIIRDTDMRELKDPRSNPRQATTGAALGDPHIYLNAWTDTYQKARKGDPEAERGLAAILAHENAHVYGKDDSIAYEVQLETLRRLGAKPSTIRKLELSRDHALEQLRNSTVTGTGSE